MITNNYSNCALLTDTMNNNCPLIYVLKTLENSIGTIARNEAASINSLFVVLGGSINACDAIISIKTVALFLAVLLLGSLFLRLRARMNDTE